jgi:HTH-type transcriptional regulator/antitoxin HipB
MKTNKLTNWDDHLDNKYGKVGTPTRDKYEEEFEAFKIGVLIQFQLTPFEKTI